MENIWIYNSNNSNLYDNYTRECYYFFFTATSRKLKLKKKKTGLECSKRRDTRNYKYTHTHTYIYIYLYRWLFRYKWRPKSFIECILHPRPSTVVEKVFRAGECRATSPEAREGVWRIRFFFFARQDGFTGRPPLQGGWTSQEGRVPWLPYNRHDDTTPLSLFSQFLREYTVLISFNHKVDSFPPLRWKISWIIFQINKYSSTEYLFLIENIYRIVFKNIPNPCFNRPQSIRISSSSESCWTLRDLW